MAEFYNDMTHEQIREFLETLHDKFNCEEFIEADPISVPHSFTLSHDREIAGLLASTIAWGNRKAIVKSAHRMMRYMDNAPYDFVVNASSNELEQLSTYVHRTFNGEDFQDFVRGMRHIITRWGSIGSFFEERYDATHDLRVVLSEFRKEFHSVEHNPHSEKHMSSIDRGAACKRLCMYLRWMVRREAPDLGLWKKMNQANLYAIMDTHVCQLAAPLLSRRQADWKTCTELTNIFRSWSAEDPLKYDLALMTAADHGF